MLLLTACAALTLGPALQPQSSDSHPHAPALRPTRSDLAFAYLDVERAFHARQFTDDQIADANRTFDTASRAFLRAAWVDAFRALNQTSGDLSAQSAAAAAGRPAAIARSLQVRIVPPVYIRGSTSPITARLGALYAVHDDAAPFSPAAPPGTWLTLAAYRSAPSGADAAAKAFYTPISFPVSGDADASVTIDLAPLLVKDAPEGAYTVVLVAPGQTRRLCTWTLSDRQLDPLREANASTLDELEPAHPALAQAIAIGRARNALLTDRPSAGESAQFLADLPRLSHEVEAEIGQLAQGQNPYSGRRGDWWMSFTISDAPVPARIYCPPAPAEGAVERASRPPSGNTQHPYPLLIALHGAGGDECLFMEAYGLGAIKPLANRHGFLVVSPRSGPFLATPTALDAIIEQTAALYPIDRDRIYVIGHSLGGNIAAAWARTRRGTLAAACCIATISTFKPGEPIAPTLVIAAELDGISTLASVRRRQEEALKEMAAAGNSPVEFREIKGYGHTLVVGKCLPEVVEWLLAHRRNSDPQRERQEGRNEGREENAGH